MSERSTSIREYRFTPGSLTADANGNLSTTTNYSINGTIQKITLEGGNFAATGSLYLFTSGTVQDKIFTVISGTALGNTAGNVTYNPFVYPLGPTGVTGSPQAFFKPTSCGPLVVIGSGLGNGASGLSLAIQWI